MCEAVEIVKAIEAEVVEARDSWIVTPEGERVPPAFFRKYIEGLSRAAEIVRNNRCRSEEHFSDPMSGHLLSSPEPRDISSVTVGAYLGER